MSEPTGRSQADAGSEADRIARYERIQRDVCATVEAPFEAPDYSKLVWLGPTVPEGNRRIAGSRHAATEAWSGWSLIAADRPRPAPSEIRFEHLFHVVTIREDLLPYLGLPVGWTFEIFADGSWHAWSPRDRLLTWIPNFLADAAATPTAAIAIADLIAEQFDGTDLHARVEDPLRTWARDGGDPARVRDALEWGQRWLGTTEMR